MFDDIGNNSDSEPVSTLDKLGATVALTGISHAMTDYLLSDEHLFRGFCDMLGITDRTPENDSADVMNPEELRQSLQSAHDTLASMHARATSLFLLASVLSPEGPDALAAIFGESEEEEEEASFIRTDGYPYI